MLVVVALVLWFKLPQWEPEWVSRNSPFVEPVLRAAGSEMLKWRNESRGTQSFDERVLAWGVSMVPQIKSGLASSDHQVRCAAVAACEILIADAHFRPDAELFSALVDVLGDARAKVRSSAASVLGVIGDSKAVVPLMIQLASEVDSNAAAKMCRALANFRDRRVLGVLDRIIKGPAPTRSEAILVCEALRTFVVFDYELAMPSLIHSLDHPHYVVRVAAVRLLGERKERRVIDALLGRLADPNHMVVENAVLALLGIPEERTIEPVLKALEVAYNETFVSSIDPIEYFVNFSDHEEEIDRLPFSPDQRRRWEALRQR